MKKLLMDWMVKMYILTIMKYLNFKKYNYKKRNQYFFYLLEQHVLFSYYRHLQLQLTVVTIHRDRVVVISLFMEFILHQANKLLMLIYFKIMMAIIAYLGVICRFKVEMDAYNWTHNLQIKFYPWLIIQIYQTQLIGAKFKQLVRVVILYPHYIVLAVLQMVL